MDAYNKMIRDGQEALNRPDDFPHGHPEIDPTDDEREARKVAEERYPTLRPHPGEAMYPKSALHHYKQGAFIAGWKARRPVQGEPLPGYFAPKPMPQGWVQSEPTDAQVEAALQEWWYGENEETWEAKMRAALRAAFKEGTN